MEARLSMTVFKDQTLEEAIEIMETATKSNPSLRELHDRHLGDARKITREEYEDARQVARDIAKTEQYLISMKLRKKVEMLFAHLKRILGVNRLRLRGPRGANDEFLLAATAQNLRKLAKVIPEPQQSRNV